jgi:hypothetical protein
MLLVFLTDTLPQQLDVKYLNLQQAYEVKEILTSVENILFM